MAAIEAGRPDYKTLAQEIFAANFMRDLEVELADVGPGWCESRLAVKHRHLQQAGFLHAAVAAAMADHSGGCAAATTMRPDQSVLTVEFKINLLRPGVGQQVRCRADVLKPGNTMAVSESQVFMENDGTEKLIAKAMVTLAFVSTSS